HPVLWRKIQKLTSRELRPRLDQTAARRRRRRIDRQRARKIVGGTLRVGSAQSKGTCIYVSRWIARVRGNRRIERCLCTFAQSKRGARCAEQALTPCVFRVRLHNSSERRHGVFIFPMHEHCAGAVVLAV